MLVDRGEITYFVQREHLLALLPDAAGRRGAALRAVQRVSGVDYLGTPDRLHSVYHLTSMTYRRRIRLEVAVTAEDPHVPSVTGVYPTADWHERET